MLASLICAYASVAKSTLFLRNWATFILLLRVVFLVHGLKQNPLPLWNAISTVYDPCGNPAIELVLDVIGLVLSSSWAGFVMKSWQPWLMHLSF